VELFSEKGRHLPCRRSRAFHPQWPCIACGWRIVPPPRDGVHDVCVIVCKCVLGSSRRPSPQTSWSRSTTYSQC
jgi:hypothetical protein